MVWVEGFLDCILCSILLIWCKPSYFFQMHYCNVIDIVNTLIRRVATLMIETMLAIAGCMAVDKRNNNGGES